MRSLLLWSQATATLPQVNPTSGFFFFNFRANTCRGGKSFSLEKCESETFTSEGHVWRLYLCTANRVSCDINMVQTPFNLNHSYFKSNKKQRNMSRRKRVTHTGWGMLHLNNSREGECFFRSVANVVDIISDIDSLLSSMLFHLITDMSPLLLILLLTAWIRLLRPGKTAPED